MQTAVQDLVDDYEVITREASSCYELNYRYKKAVVSEVRDFIQPIQKIWHDDIRFDRVVDSAFEVKSFVEESLSVLGFEYLHVEDQLFRIAKMFMTRFRINRLNCRMELIYSDKCKRFHVDNVYLRSITTLIGPGTELQLKDEPENIYRVNTGDTVLVKGKQFPGQLTNVLHRSPKISHLGVPRLIFVMDY